MTIKRYEVDGKLMNLDDAGAKRLGLDPEKGQERVRKHTDYPIDESPAPTEEVQIVTAPAEAETQEKSVEAPNKARRTRQH